MKYHSTYKQHQIYRNSNGYGLPWISYVNGLFMSADTLRGIRRLITGAK